MADAADNVEQANDELDGLHKKVRTGNKCLVWCVIISLLIAIFLIVFNFVKKDAVITV